jgi:hypothetical protein
VLPAPKPPNWQLRSSRGNMPLCRSGGLWRIGNNAGQTVPGRFPSRSKRRTNSRPRRGCTPGPCGRSALRLWELGGTPRPQLSSRPPRFLGARVVVRRRLMRRVLQEVDSPPSWDRRLPLSAPLVTPTSGTWPHRAADAAGEVAPCSKLGTRPLGDRVFHFLDPWEPRQALLLELFCL